MKNMLLLGMSISALVPELTYSRIPNSPEVIAPPANEVTVNTRNNLQQIQNSAGGAFILKGKVNGQESGYVYLTYTGREGKRRRDSALIRNYAFKFEGNVSYPQMAYFSGPVKSRRNDDPNYTGFYLEPGLITLITEVNDFKNARITGSKSQEEYSALEKSKKAVELKYKKQLDSLETENDHEKSAEIRERLAPYFLEMDQTDFQFFDKHRMSYVTAFLLRFHVSDLTLDSLQLFYDRLGPTIQQTADGKELSEEIKQLKSGSPGSMAKNFTTTDINGNKLSLSDFKGSYVLLDFWASWCVPCRKGNPHLKELYAKYKDKGIEFVGISDDDTKPEAWQKAVEKDALPWKHVLRGMKYEKGILDKTNDISIHFGIHSLPTKILIDKEGKIIGRYSEEEGPLDAMLVKIFGN